MSLFRFLTLRMSPSGWVAFMLGVFSPLAFATLPIQYWVQPSGARIYFIESAAIPIVDVQIDFDAGTRRDPAGKPALANLTADTMESGIVARDARRGPPGPAPGAGPRPAGRGPGPARRGRRTPGSQVNIVLRGPTRN